MSDTDPVYGELFDYGGAVFNVRHPEFGAVGDGVTNDRPAIVLALAAAASGGVVFFPAGTYLLSSSLTIAASTVMSLQFAAGAVLSHGTNALTIDAPLDAGRYPIFTGTGTVTLGANAAPDGIYPEWFGAAWNGSADDTLKIQQALDAGRVHNWRRGTTMVDLLTIPADTYIRTAGIETVVQQKTGSGIGVRVLNVTGSNVTLGDITVRGNIAADRTVSATDEQKHAIFIYSSGAVLTNIRLGRVVAEDVCGDGVYAGGAGGVRGLRVDAVECSNVLRNGVSIIGATDVWVGSVTGTQVGLCMVDVEPNASDAACSAIRVDYVRGGRVQVAGQTTNLVGDVSFGFLELDPAYQPNSVPGYTGHYDVTNAVVLENYRSVDIERLYTNGFNGRSVGCLATTVLGEQVRIGFFTCPTGSLTDTTYNSLINAQGVRSLVIDGFEVVLGSASKMMVLGLSAGVPPAISTTRARIANGTINGCVAQYVDRSSIENVTIDTAYDAYVISRCTNTAVARSDLAIGRLAGYSTHCTFEQVRGTFASFVFDGANLDHVVRDSTINGVYHQLTIWNRSYQNAIRMGPPGVAGAYLWADANGSWRALGGGSPPTADLDGGVLGGRVVRITTAPTLAASTNVAVPQFDTAINAGQILLFEYELYVTVSGGTAGLRPLFTLPAGTAGEFACEGDGGAAGTFLWGTPTNSLTSAYSTAFLTASFTGRIRIKATISGGSTAGTVALFLQTGAAAAGSVLVNSSLRVQAR